MKQNVFVATVSISYFSILLFGIQIVLLYLWILSSQTSGTPWTHWNYELKGVNLLTRTQCNIIYRPLNQKELSGILENSDIWQSFQHFRLFGLKNTLKSPILSVNLKNAKFLDFSQKIPAFSGISSVCWLKFQFEISEPKPMRNWLNHIVCELARLGGKWHLLFRFRLEMLCFVSKQRNTEENKTKCTHTHAKTHAHTHARTF